MKRSVEVQGGDRPRMLIHLGGCVHSLTFAEASSVSAELAAALVPLARALAARAVAAAVDGALGEVARQTGGGHPQILREAKTNGSMAAWAYLDAIYKPCDGVSVD